MEAATIAGMIKGFAVAKKFQLSQIAILVRAGYQTRSFEEAFIQNSLPYKVIGGMKFYERLEIRDAIAYLRICANFDDDLALNRIINVPKRGCGDVAISSLYERSKLEKISLFTAIKKSLAENLIKGKAREALSDLIEKLEKFNSQIASVNLFELAKSLLGEVGYIKMWKSENTLEAQGRIENIEEFTSSLADFSSMVEFLEYVSLVEVRDEKNLQDAVSVMTVHAAKGLEFDLVFVPGLEDGIFPSSKSIDERNGLEEERRLMYVAITRAKKELILSFTKNRYVFGDFQMQLPSRFIKELPEAEINFEEIFFGNQQQSSFSGKRQANFTANNKSKFFVTSPTQKKSQTVDSNSKIGERVFHQKFGYGKVVDEDGNKLDIQFEKTGKKTVIKDFVNFV